MKHDQYGVAYTDSEELFWMLYKNPKLDLSKISVNDPSQFNQAVSSMYADIQMLSAYQPKNHSIAEFDQDQQSRWHMPDNYKNMDIAQWVLDQCSTQEELQRVGQELLMFQERELFDLLRYLKYFVDTMRQHSVMWGLGRGSSVASYVLYLIGVHKINSIYYDLDIREFLK
jgi:DNA polymerase III alpha subunit